MSDFRHLCKIATYICDSATRIFSNYIKLLTTNFERGLQLEQNGLAEEQFSRL